MWRPGGAGVREILLGTVEVSEVGIEAAEGGGEALVAVAEVPLPDGVGAVCSQQRCRSEIAATAQPPDRCCTHSPPPSSSG